MPSEEWYKPSEIRFRKNEVLWLIRNLSIISAGTWPPEHKETGYTGNKGKAHSHSAHFEIPETIAGEIEARLSRCGLDGLALEFVTRLADGDDVYVIQRIANYQRRPFLQVKDGIKLALRYCRGYHRKHVSYSRFCDYTKPRDNKTKSQVVSLARR